MLASLVEYRGLFSWRLHLVVVTLRIFSIIRVGKLLAKGTEENTFSLYQRVPAFKYPTTVAQKQQEQLGAKSDKNRHRWTCWCMLIVASRLGRLRSEARA